MSRVLIERRECIYDTEDHYAVILEDRLRRRRDIGRLCETGMRLLAGIRLKRGVQRQVLGISFIEKSRRSIWVSMEDNRYCFWNSKPEWSVLSNAYHRGHYIDRPLTNRLFRYFGVDCSVLPKSPQELVKLPLTIRLSKRKIAPVTV